jgi:hypothetical protein
MAIQVKNVTQQAFPVIIPGDNGGTEIILRPRKTVVLALDKPTPQLTTLKNKGFVKIK